jgi:hypothetical protein
MCWVVLRSLIGARILVCKTSGPSRNCNRNRNRNRNRTFHYILLCHNKLFRFGVVLCGDKTYIYMHTHAYIPAYICNQAISESISSRSMAVGKSSTTTRPQRPFKITPGVPDWTKIQIMDASVYKYKLPDTVDEIVKRANLESTTMMSSLQVRFV